VTLLIVCLTILALVSFVVLLAALRAGSSDPGFHAGSAETEVSGDDDEDRAA
jgi:hypothetical protein